MKTYNLIMFTFVILFLSDAFSDECQEKRNREPDFLFYKVEKPTEVYEQIVTKKENGPNGPDVSVISRSSVVGTIKKGWVLAPKTSSEQYVVMYVCESLSEISFPAKNPRGRVYLIKKNALTQNSSVVPVIKKSPAPK